MRWKRRSLLRTNADAFEHADICGGLALESVCGKLIVCGTPDRSPTSRRRRQCRVMVISIDPYIAGVPHRIKYLEQLLDYIIGHDGVALMTASEIGDRYRAEMKRISPGG